ncbi:MAG: hypothetical protein GY788_06190 [bacterium]|nr:hypothetical protein [bacterium]
MAMRLRVKSLALNLVDIVARERYRVSGNRIAGQIEEQVPRRPVAGEGANSGQIRQIRSELVADSPVFSLAVYKPQCRRWCLIGLWKSRRAV